MRQRHSELKLFRLLGCLRFPDEGVIFGSLSSQDRGEKEVCDCDDDKIGEIESKLSLGLVECVLSAKIVLAPRPLRTRCAHCGIGRRKSNIVLNGSFPGDIRR